MAVTGGYLGQVMPSGTKPVPLYVLATGLIVRVTTICICNHTAGGLTYSLYFNNDGSIFLPENFLYSDESIAANETLWLPRNEDGGDRPSIWMGNAAGALGFQASAGDALTATAFGIITS